MRRAVLIFNPRAGQRRARRALPEIRQVLERCVRAFPAADRLAPTTAGRSPATRSPRRLDAFFVLGGDGTLRVAASVLAGSEVAIGALPGGTTNVVAGALGLPDDPVAAARALLTAEADRDGPRPVGRRAVPHAALRRARRANHGAHELRLRRSSSARGRWRWPASTSGCAIAFRVFTSRSTASRPRRPASWSPISRSTPASSPSCPERAPTTGKLELLLFHGRAAATRSASPWRSPRAPPRAARRCRGPSFTSLRVTAPVELQLQADGDAFITAAPLTVTLAPERLKILAPCA